ncbi:MAG: hypothetical protein D4R88_07120 [Methanosarcinales archaeon]|nr:MAG: hypothetical protein D4R88_07120 [Methanosarcinales archaeon]
MTSLIKWPEIDVNFELAEDRLQFVNHPSILEATEYILSVGEYKEKLLYQVGVLIQSCHDRKQFGFWVAGKIKSLRLEPDNEILKRLIKVADILRKIYEPTQDTDNLRGAFLESMAFKLLKIKFDFGSPKSGIACFIIIFNKTTWKSKKTVDVAFWLKPYGECHECKVSGGINESHILNLNAISSNSFGMVKVAITTLRESNTLRDQLSTVPLGNVFIYGRDNIFSICNT